MLAIMAVSVDMRMVRISGANCDDSKTSWFLVTIYVSRLRNYLTMTVS